MKRDSQRLTAHCKGVDCRRASGDSKGREEIFVFGMKPRLLVRNGQGQPQVISHSFSYRDDRNLPRTRLTLTIKVNRRRRPPPAIQSPVANSLIKEDSSRSIAVLYSSIETPNDGHMDHTLLISCDCDSASRIVPCFSMI